MLFYFLNVIYLENTNNRIYIYEFISHLEIWRLRSFMFYESISNGQSSSAMFSSPSRNHYEIFTIKQSHICFSIRVISIT